MESVGDGRKYFILSSKFLKVAGLRLGDIVDFRFNIDDHDFVELPPELEAALVEDAALSDIWNDLSAGRKRFFCHQISSARQQSARQQATRHRRLEAVVADLKA